MSSTSFGRGWDFKCWRAGTWSGGSVGGHGHCPEPVERSHDLLGPGPVTEDVAPDAAGVADDPSGGSPPG